MRQALVKQIWLSDVIGNTGLGPAICRMRPGPSAFLCTMIPLLEPVFRGPLAAQGDKLACSPTLPQGAIPLRRLLHGSTELDRLVRGYAQQLGCTGRDLRAAASAWSMAYLEALLPPVCAAATLLQHVFPIEAQGTAVILTEAGVPRSFHVLHDGTSQHGSSALERYRPLVWEHLSPLFDSLHTLTRIPPKILWSNCARHLEGIFEVAQSLAPGASLIAIDRDMLLNAPGWPSARSGETAPPNPLHGLKRVVLLEEAGRQTARHLHRQCCLFYKLPNTGYCVACPLDPQYRRAPLL